MLEILTYYVYAPVYSLRSPFGSDKVLCPFNMRCMLSGAVRVQTGCANDAYWDRLYVRKPDKNRLYYAYRRQRCTTPANTMECPDAKDL
ncbi:hypothetical protein DaDZ19_47170 [Dickeya ananatis]